MRLSTVRASVQYFGAKQLEADLEDPDLCQPGTKGYRAIISWVWLLFRKKQREQICRQSFFPHRIDKDRGLSGLGKNQSKTHLKPSRKQHGR